MVRPVPLSHTMATGIPVLSTLLKRATIVDHDEVLNAADAALEQKKADLNTQHIKVVALLQLERYTEVVHVFEEAGEKLKKTAQLEYAYALYKSGDLERAKDIAQEIEDNRGARHLEAQTVRFFVIW